MDHNKTPSSVDDISPVAKQKQTNRMALFVLVGIVVIVIAFGVRNRVEKNRVAKPPGLNDSKVIALRNELERLHKIIETNPKDVDARWKLADQYQKIGQLESAHEQLEQIVQLQPDKPEGYIALGNTRIAIGKLDEAASPYAEAVKRFPKNLEALQGLGAVQFQQKRYLDAMHTMQQAFAQDKADPNTQLILAASALEYAMLFPEPGTHSNELALAAALCNQLLKTLPDNGEIYFMQGRALAELHLRVKSLDALKRAYELLPERGEVAFYYARALDQSGQRGEAQRVAEAAIARKTEYPLLYELVGGIYLSSSDPNALQKATAAIEKAAELMPELARFQEKKGVVYLRAGRLEEARQAFEKTLQADPNRAFPYQQLAVIFARLGNKEQSRRASTLATQMTANEQKLTQMQRLSELYPRDTKLLMILADRYVDLTKLGAARETYLRVLKLEPKNERALNGITKVEKLLQETKKS